MTQMEERAWDDIKKGNKYALWIPTIPDYVPIFFYWLENQFYRRLKEKSI